MHRGSGVEIFIFVDTLTQFGYLYVKVGPASEPETCALIGYPRVKNVFSFDSHFDSPQNNKKKEMLVACIISYLNSFFCHVNKSFSNNFG